jgi:hypothetical protein
MGGDSYPGGRRVDWFLMDTFVAYAANHHGIKIVAPSLSGGRVLCSIPDDPGVGEHGDLDAKIADLLLVERGFRRVFAWRRWDAGLWVTLVTWLVPWCYGAKDPL